MEMNMMELQTDTNQAIEHDHHNIIYFTTVQDPFGWLDNMYPAPVRFEDAMVGEMMFGEMTFGSAEALFQWMRFDGHPDLQRRIHAATTSKGARKIAKDNRDLLGNARNWDNQPLDLGRMERCLRLKMEQHPDLRERLVATGDRVLIKNSARTKGGAKKFWGAEFDQATNLWRGANIKGQMLMHLREEYSG
jgi:ribA/ribD-fused uncharacterized protein